MSPLAAAADTISPAAGAAARPPYPAFSMMMANAILFVGATVRRKADEPGVRRRLPTSAVPVFPAIRHGWRSRLRPVPVEDGIAHVLRQRAPRRPAKQACVCALSDGRASSLRFAKHAAGPRSPPPPAPSAAASRPRRPGRSRPAEACRGGGRPMRLESREMPTRRRRVEQAAAGRARTPAARSRRCTTGRGRRACRSSRADACRARRRGSVASSP